MTNVSEKRKYRKQLAGMPPSHEYIHPPPFRDTSGSGVKPAKSAPVTPGQHHGNAKSMYIAPSPPASPSSPRRSPRRNNMNNALYGRNLLKTMQLQRAYYEGFWIICFFYTGIQLVYKVIAAFYH